MNTNLVAPRLLAALALTASACTSRTTVPLPDPTQVATIGSRGGEIVSPDGKLSVVFPAGALSADTQVSVAQDSRTQVSGQRGPTYRVEPAGMHAAVPVTLTVQLGADFTPEADMTPMIVRVDARSTSPVMTSSYDAAAHTVHATIDALASYTVLVHAPRTTCDVADGGMPYESKIIYPCWITEQEPNNSAATAQPTDLRLDEGIDLLGSMDGDDDHYSFEVPAGSVGAIDGVVHSVLGNYGSCDPGLAVDGELLDANGNVLTRGWHNAACVGFNYRVDPGARDLPPGRYIIRLFQGAGGQPRPYRFALYLLGPSNGTVIIGPDSGI